MSTQSTSTAQAPTSTADTGYLRADGTPNLPILIQIFNRCAPTVQGGTAWMDNVRFCRWAGQFTDGKKHDVPGGKNGAAMPWDNASDVRPFVVDDIINERKAMLVAAFWRSIATGHGGGDDESSSYAIALLEWLMFTKMWDQLIDEVDLSADYQEHIGWCLLAPRWSRELGMRRFKLKFSDLQQAAAGAPPDSPYAQLPTVIMDPVQEDLAVELLHAWYDWYVKSKLPEDMQARVPVITTARVRKALQDLRTDQEATVPLPYICKNQPEIHALKPYDEAFVPPELTTENEIVFQLERVSEAELRGRIITDNYDPAWVEAALKHKGQWTSTTLPVGNQVGLGGLLGTGTPIAVAPVQSPGYVTDGAVEVIYAIYRAPDEDGIPAVYCTTFHRAVTKETGSQQDLYGKHEVVESPDGEMPYSALTRERWCRSLASSRGVPEMANTQQNIVKGILDGIIDRQSITLMPPVNVYESPTGTKYQFGPAKQNYVRQGREPEFMQMPSGQGMADASEVLATVKNSLDNRFANMSPDVPAPRQQVFQEHGVRRFLAGWTKAFKQILKLYQQHGEDAEFADVTGAPPGWLDQNRDQPGLFAGVGGLEFDPRELDADLEMKRIEAFNTVVLPNDVLGVVNRGEWATEMARGILGSRRAKRLVQPQPEASQALMDKARNEVLQMFAHNPPNYVDVKDPTAAGLLQYTKQVVTANPTYLRALDDEAIVALAGQNAPALIQQIGPRHPDPVFSDLMTKWLQNLQFTGVTQPANKQIGRIGVDPQIQTA